MSSRIELAYSHTALSEADRDRLSVLITEWQLLADLSFADLVLWVPRRKDYQSWPEGHVAIAHIRPTTASTVFTQDLIGLEIPWGKNSRIDQSLSQGEIVRDAEPEQMGELLIKEETVPVFFENRVIAVISRHRDAISMRSPSRLELNYREIAHKIYRMVSEGTFPIQDSIYQAEAAPRVGDGLIRLNAQGITSYASPNARSAVSRLGWETELEGNGLGAIFDSLSLPQNQPTEENWATILSGRNLRRADFDNGNGIVDLLVIPLIEGQERIGSIVLLHDVTELRRRDRDLVTKDATIREIHHRVKNNLQTVSALLRLQSRRVEDPIASAALAEAVRRVASIAIVHETLSASSAESVLFDEVYERIVHNAIELSPRAINLKKIGEFGVLDSQTATPLSLVITELIHNALEHGLAETGDELLIEIQKSDSARSEAGALGAHGKTRYEISIMDNGSGLPEGFDWQTSSNLGLQIVRTLTENELKGSITLMRKDGKTVALLTFDV
jgi:two-component sensor histidine kinase